MMGLCGASSVGKTTLARAISEALEVPLISSKIGQVYESFGLNYKSSLTFEQRMLVQDAILETHLADVKASSYPFISDRTPIDFAAYTMADLANVAETEEDQDRVLAYVERCLEATSWNFHCVVLVQPGVPFVEDERRPMPSKTAQELRNTLCWAYMRDSRVTSSTWYLNRKVIDLEARIHGVLKIWEDRLTCLEHRATETIH